jgi:hypothetical protein
LNNIREKIAQHIRHIGPKIIRAATEIILVFLVLWILLTQAGKGLCKQAIAKLAEATNTQITTDSLAIRLDGAIILRGLTIKNKDNGEILKAQKVRTDFAWGSLLLFRPRIKRIILSDFTLNLQYNQGEKIWNLTGLKGLKRKPTGKIPLIRLINGRLLYSKVSRKQEKMAADISFAAKISANAEGQAQRKENAICFFEITMEQWLDFGKSKITGSIEPGRAEVEGRIWQSESEGNKLTAENLKAIFEFKENRDYSLKLDIAKLTSAKRSIEGAFKNLRFLFPEQIGAFETLQDVFDRFRPGGQIDLNIEFWGNLKQLNSSKLIGNVQCRDVWVLDENFEYRIENLKGRIGVTERSAVLQELSGRHGEVELQINGWTNKLPEGQELQFKITSDNMLLDNDLYEALSDNQKKFWDDFNPKGMAAINQFIAKKGTKGKTNILKVSLLDTQAQWRTFPYPLKNLTGQLSFDSNQIAFSNVVSQSEDEKIIVNGKVTGYEMPKPLYDIEIKGENIRSDFIKEDKYQESLAKLLSEYFKNLIGELQFTGKTNCLAHFNNFKNREKTDFKIELDCLGDRIEHAKYPYPVRDLRGRITIENESILLQDIAGTLAGNIPITAESSRIKVNGLIKAAENRFSEADIRLEAKDMSFDERLSLVLPASMQETYSGIEPTGRFDISFNDLKIKTNEDGEKYFDFNSVIRLKGCNFKVTLPVTDFNGPIRIKGLYKSGYGFVKGQTKLEGCGMRIEDEQLSEMQADIKYDADKHIWQSDDLTATCYDGQAMGKLQFEKQGDKKASYLLDIGFNNIDLRRFLADSKSGRKEIKEIPDTKKTEHGEGSTGGNMNGSLSVQGTMGDDSDRIGTCRLKITDMQVGKLSPIAKLLYILNLTEPRNFAFEQMVVDSYIQGNKMILKKVDFSGKALAFNGSGELNLENFNIDVILTARGRRLAGASPGVIQSLGEGLGQGIVQVDVKGNIYDPQIKVRTLPVIEGTLQILGSKE